MPTIKLSDAQARRLGVDPELLRRFEVRPNRTPRAEGPDWPGTLAGQARMAGLPLPVRELRWLADRKFRFDLAWPEFRVACEVDGGVHAVGSDGQQGGRHQRPAGFERDCEKLSLAAAHGWRVLKVTPAQVERGEAIGWVERALLGGPPW